MDKNDYLISIRKITDDDTIQSEWLGVRNKVDNTSIDEWASEVG